ncbi:hypothetical protein AGMMS50289_17280 [Betaproteobacteria bacterium]|nr:hypothetical protein AGMMS50289_17280 [Betaproteobacteria bacterium]
MAKFSFDETVNKIKTTPTGKEASMYGPIRDLFIQVLGYPASDVDIDTSGEGGRPDVTVRAPTGYREANGKDSKTDWIVVEAKDEHNCFFDAARREIIFAKKSKYVGTHTAWFVMIEPVCMVLRSVGGGDLSAAADIVIALDGLNEADFLAKAVALKARFAGVSQQLEKFRSGDTTMIAVEKLQPQDASRREVERVRLSRKRFFRQIQESTLHLQAAVSGALLRLQGELREYADMADAFWLEFGKAEDGFDEHSLSLRGRPRGPDSARKHDREAARLKRIFAKSPHVARLALTGLPQFQSRTGVDDDKLHELFSIETANLILARVLLLRFFEDHGFFGDMRYVCNGGVAAFQEMKRYFRESYARLLEYAYRRGSQLYASAFEATELDWIFGSVDEALSSAIELTMFRFSRYNFKTIKGDILTGIYDRFMNREQRKKMGEFYTPPSIARYMLKRMGVSRNSRVLDPACGSGTFLIESYRVMVGNDLERGVAEYADILAAFGRIAGNDLNTFSAVLSQIQLLWQILGQKDDIEQHGFPDVLVTGKVNSLVERDQWTALDRFAEIDIQEYDAVIGNPPYVRAERSAQALDERSQKEFERSRNGFPGISSKLNAYALFLFRALDRWAKPARDGEPAGKVGFVLPVSLFDGNETASLRKLFAIGGRWTIKEIVDLEVIWRSVFDAKAITAILIAENRPATEEDTVSIRFADASCVKPQEGDSLPEFDLESMPEALVPYHDIFSPDGRILTRVTPSRLAILRKLWEGQTFEDIAKPYWVRKVGSRIVDWKDEPQPGWEARRMIAGGVAFRGNKARKKKGTHVYKGENIIAAELQGDPALASADLDNIDDASLWRYDSILPPRGLAIAGVAHCPNGVVFDPGKAAFTNTASLFFPKNTLSDVPFDLLLMSNVYVWFYAIAARMGVLDTLRSHIYPTNLAFLPWNDTLAAKAPEIEAMRTSLISACTNRLRAAEATKQALSDLGFQTVKHRIRADKDARISFGEHFSESKYEAVLTISSLQPFDDDWRVRLSADMFDWVECNRLDIAEGLKLALAQKEGEAVGKSAILNMPIPGNDVERSKWKEVVAKHGEEALKQAMTDALTRLDALVGVCLGLAPDDIRKIQQDLAEDPFLRGIRPRYPGTVTRKQGFRTGLDDSDRYQ